MVEYDGDGDGAAVLFVLTLVGNTPSGAVLGWGHRTTAHTLDPENNTNTRHDTAYGCQ